MKFLFDNYTNIATVNGKMCVRSRNVAGKPMFYRAGYKPRLYVPCQPSNSEVSKFRTLDGRPTAEVVTDGIYESREWIEKTKMHGVEVHGDIHPTYQFLNRAFRHTSGACPMDRIRIAVLDLEVNDSNGFPHPEAAREPITALSVGIDNTVHTWAYKDYFSTDPYHVYHRCVDEHDMLIKFMDWWSADYPDILTGWNVQFFDTAYLINRLRNQFGAKMAKRLSPWKKITKRNAIVQHRPIVVEDICGIAILDYLELYKKFSMGQQENYRLDTIANVELGERKLSYDEYSTLGKLYHDNFDLYIKYNVQDVRLVQKLDVKKKYLALVMDLAHTAKVNYADCLKQTRLWDALIFNELMNDGIVIPPRKDRTKSEKYEGAYVKEVQTGNHAWVVSFDVNSLYPSLMRQWNISPDKLMPKEAVEAKLCELCKAMGVSVPSLKVDLSNKTGFPSLPITWQELPAQTRPEWLSSDVTKLSTSDAALFKTALEQTLVAMQVISVDLCLTHEDEMNRWMQGARFLGLVISPNNQSFKLDAQGFLPRILTRLYDERVKAKDKQIAAEKRIEEILGEIKRRGLTLEALTDEELFRQLSVARGEKEQYDVIQSTRKVGLNSAYGALGAVAFRYFDVRQAEAVTLSGKVVIQKVERNVNDWLNKALKTANVDYIIGSDTDSIYVRLEQLMKFVPNFDALPISKKIDVVNKISIDKIQPIINQTFISIAENFGTIDPCLVMKRESIANRGIWTKKKHYILNVYDKEGVRYEKPKLKMVGIEAVKSSTPTVCRKKIKEAIEIIMGGAQSELWTLIHSFEQSFRKLPFEDVAFPKSSNNHEKFRQVMVDALTGEETAICKSPLAANGKRGGVPIQVRAAFVYNEYLRKQGLDRAGYRLLNSGDKVKFAYLQTPNFLHSNVVASPDGLPREWSQLKIDYDIQFEKTFLNPLKHIIEHAGWTMEEERTMDDLWG